MNTTRDRIVAAIEHLRRYTPLEDCTAARIADAILLAIPELATLEGLKCRDCGGNLTELDITIGDGLCVLCRDIATEAAA